METYLLQRFFSEEIQAAGGTVSDCYDDGERLFLRSVLPREEFIVPGDAVQPGVALRAAVGQVSIHPYVFRQVCKNGATWAHAIETRIVKIAAQAGPREIEEAVRGGVRACLTKDAFDVALSDMRAAVTDEIDLALNMVPLLSRLSQDFSSKIAQRVIETVFGEMRPTRRGFMRSRYELMNAITSVARDADDPDDRWNLEELGGGIAACLEFAPEKRWHDANALPSSRSGDSELVTFEFAQERELLAV